MSDEEAWPLSMGRINYVVVLYGTSIYPDAAKRIEWGMADDERCFLWQMEAFAKLFNVAFRVTSEVMRPLNSTGYQLVSQFWIGTYIDDVFSGGFGAGGACMACKKVFRHNCEGKTVIKNLHFPDILGATEFQQFFFQQHSLEDTVFTYGGGKAIMVSSDVIKISRKS